MQLGVGNPGGERGDIILGLAPWLGEGGLGGVLAIAGSVWRS